MSTHRLSRSKLLATAAILSVPLLVSGAAWAAGGDPAAAQKYQANAEKLIAKDDYKGALIELKNAVRASPDDPALRLKLAEIELRLNDVDGAQVDLKSAKEHGAPEAKVIQLMSRTYLMQGKYDDLLRDFVVRDDQPVDARVATLVARADAQLQTKHIEDARSSLVAAEQLQPDAVTPKLGLARIAFTQDQLDEAAKKADEILKIAPSADAHILKGEILNKQKNRDAAIGEFEAAIKAEPTNIAGYIERAQLYIANNQDDKAEADVKTALGLAPRSVPASYLEALIDARRKDYNAADTILTKIAAAFPSFPRGFYLQAIVKSALKQNEQAENAISAYLAAVPDDVVGRKVHADIMLRKGNPAGAAETLEQVVAQSPDDFQALIMLGQAYMQARKPQQAVETFERAEKLAPNDPAVLRGLALNHLAVGKGTEGRDELEKALQLSPDDQPAAEALVLVYMRSKDFDKAKKLVDDMKKRKPDDPIAPALGGMVELAQSHLPEAENAYKDVEKRFPDFTNAKLQLAYIYSLEGKPDQAKAKYQEILSKEPANPQALQNLSLMLQNEKQPQQVIDLWQKAHRAQPDSILVALGLVQAYIYNKDPDGGLAVVRDMLLRQNNEPRLYAMRAELELQKNQPKDAVVSLQRLTELRPQDAAARRDLAMAQEKAGDLQGAIATVAEARKLDPNNVVLAGQEVSLLGKRSPDDGIAAAQRLANQMPDQPVAQAMEGDYLMTLKRPADAAAAYQKAFQARPSLLLAERLVGVALRDGKTAEAGKILTDWQASHPNDVAAKLALANFVLGQKDWANARTKYEALATERPEDPIVLNNLAVIYQHDGNDAKALEFAQKAQAAAPRSPAIADTLGWILVQKTDVPSGLKLLEQAHDGAPNDLDVQYHLAFALDRSGKKAEAADLLKKAIAAGRDFDSKKDAEALLAQLSKT